VKHNKVRMQREEETEPSILFTCLECRKRIRVIHVLGRDIRLTVPKFDYYCRGDSDFHSSRENVCQVELLSDED
jgi:hypothetical protein